MAITCIKPSDYTALQACTPNRSLIPKCKELEARFIVAVPSWSLEGDVDLGVHLCNPTEFTFGFGVKV